MENKNFDFIIIGAVLVLAGALVGQGRARRFTKAKDESIM